MKKRFILSVTAVLTVFLLLSGCASLLPSSKQIVKSSWQSYQDVQTNFYDGIIPGQTTMKDLKKRGFDPQKTPNVRIHNATSITNRFMPSPSIKKEDLPIGVQRCLENRDRCIAYQFKPSDINDAHVGNFWLDTLTFIKKIRHFGWEFIGYIIVLDNVIVYKDPSEGDPNIDTLKIEKKPLGPLQGIGNKLSDVYKISIP